MENIHQWLWENLGRDSVVVEAGTAEGTDTFIFAQIFPQGKIYSLEPIPHHFEQVKSRTSTIPHVKLFNKALSDTNGIAKMFVADRFGAPWGSSSLLQPKEHLNNNPDITFKSETEVETIKLDDFIEQNSISKIDLLWLDLQGVEPKVLQAAPNALKQTKYLYTEVSLVENYEGLVVYKDYRGFLESLGFEVVSEGIYWEDGGNVLFKNKNLI
jgi:FkbM family methyltransferase